jgi:nonsense-mediated mRNA decay protein 3
LADVQVARESDFGSNDETFNCVTHLGNLIRPGDIVLGYDLTATVGGDWEMEESFHNSFVLPVFWSRKLPVRRRTSESKNEPVKNDKEKGTSTTPVRRQKE